MDLGESRQIPWSEETRGRLHLVLIDAFISVLAQLFKKKKKLNFIPYFSPAELLQPKKRKIPHHKTISVSCKTKKEQLIPFIKLKQEHASSDRSPCCDYLKKKHTLSVKPAPRMHLAIC